MVVGRSHRSDAVVFGTAGRAGDRCRVGHPAKIRAAETRKQKHDRRDARLILDLLRRDRFPNLDALKRAARATNVAAG